MSESVIHNNGVDTSCHWRPSDADRAAYARRRREMQPAYRREVIRRAGRIRRGVPELFRTGEQIQIVAAADAWLEGEGNG